VVFYKKGIIVLLENVLPSPGSRNIYPTTTNQFGLPPNPTGIGKNKE